MSERICEQCGTSNDPSAQFCVSCDAYLGWDRGRATLAGGPLTGVVPVVSGHPDVAAEGAPRPAPAPPRAPAPASPRTPTPDAPPVTPDSRYSPPPSASFQPPRAPSPYDYPAVAAPDVVVESAAAVLRPGATAAVELTVRNASTIVDGFLIAPIDAPDWLTAAHDDAHLMPGQERPVTVTLGTRGGVLIPVQRFPLRLAVRSVADPAKAAEVTVTVTIPPVGPRLSLEVRPSLLRLEDVAAGSFVLLLDNHAANYPQTYALAASDPEGVVEFAFAPEVVEVPPGQIVEAAVRFAAPQPRPGRELSRQVSVSAKNDEGVITATVTLAQRTSPAREDAPLRVRLSPSHMRVVNDQVADFVVQIDNREGHRARTVALTAQDEEHACAFEFAATEVVAPAGQVCAVRTRIRSMPPPRGAVVSRQFTVVASVGMQDAVAAGVLEVASTPDPITTAGLEVEPRTLNLGRSRRGSFLVEVDNRRGLDPLRVRLDGQADDGTVTFRFAPPEITVRPRTVGTVTLAVQSPRPPAKESISRQISIEATDGVQTIEASASIAQVGFDWRPIASRLLVILGSVLVVIGALSPWFPFEDVQLPSIDWVTNLIETGVTDQDIQTLAEPATRVLLIVLAVCIAFGLAGKSGGASRKFAIVVLLVSVGYTAFALFGANASGIEFGIVIVWLGAILAFIGGVLGRQR